MPLNIEKNVKQGSRLVKIAEHLLAIWQKACMGFPFAVSTVASPATDIYYKHILPFGFRSSPLISVKINSSQVCAYMDQAGAR